MKKNLDSLVNYINDSHPKFALYKEFVLEDGMTIGKKFVRYIFNSNTLQGAYIRGKHYARKDCDGGLGYIHYDDDFPYAITFENIPLVCYTIEEL